MEQKLDGASPAKELQEGDLCPDCNCCGLYWTDCPSCGGEGETEPGDLHAMDPLWYDEDDTETCRTCHGACGWLLCDCDEDGKHPSPVGVAHPSPSPSPENEVTK